MAPRPGGDYDFADLDELFELAVAEGLDIVVNTILENAPYWLEQQRPQARYRDAEGREVQLPAAMNTRRARGLAGALPRRRHRVGCGVALPRSPRSPCRPIRRPSCSQVLGRLEQPHIEPASYFPERIYCYCYCCVIEPR
jgi:beta-galactosidase